MSQREKITEEELAKMSAVAFSPGTNEIPDKIWHDTYGSVSFIRAAWVAGHTPERLRRLRKLQVMLAYRYGGRFVAVAYDGEPTWDEVDAWAAALKSRQ